MKRFYNVSMVLFLAAGLLAGCASTKKAAVHPLSGMWDYSVETPDGTYNGMVSITEVEGSLVGTITNDALPGKMDLTGLMYENDEISFKFDSGEFGVLTFSGKVMDDQMQGNILMDGFGEMPVTGKKQTAEM